LVRIPVRLLFTVPLAFFLPTIALLGWRLALNPSVGIFGAEPLLGNLGKAPDTQIMIDGLTTFAFACGVGSIVYLIALRGPKKSAPTVGQVALPVLITWLIMMAVAVATALQEFGLSFTLTNGGPANSTLNLALYQYSRTFRNMQLGYGAAVSMLMLAPLFLLGGIIGLIVIASRLRLQTVPANKPVGDTTTTTKIALGLLLGVLVLFALWGCYRAFYPVVWSWSGANFPGKAGIPETLNTSNLWQNTVVPLLPAIFLIQLPIVYLAALGIGALRPLGKFSEWLLLPVSPWLFVTAVPLGLALFLNLRTAGQLNTPEGLRVPSAMLNVPMLFILTLFFKGQEQKWRVQNPSFITFLQIVILPSLPLALFLSLITLGINSHDLYWSLIAVNVPQNFTLPVFLSLVSAQYGSSFRVISDLLAQFGPPLVAITFSVLAVFQIFFADRLALGVGELQPEPVEKVEPVSDALPPQFGMHM
jgi:hypothetical protein